MNFEHLIYGTFPDLPGSQQVVFKSSGITQELESWLINQYDSFGDCRTEEFQSSLTLQWYRSEEIVLGTLTKVSHAGKDFSGRWGALLRHTAVFTDEQFRLFGGDVSRLADLLVSNGTSEELAQSGDLAIDLPAAARPSLERVLTIKLENFRENLKKLLTGERLVLFCDLNTLHINRYLQSLTRLMPMNINERLNWSEFVFHSLPNLDLSVVHSSRYSAPEADAIELRADGENGLGDARMSNDECENYLSKLDQSIREGTQEELERLLGFSDQSPTDENPRSED